MSVRANNWAWEVGRSRELGQGKLLTLLKIADHADQDGVCWPGESHLAEYTSQGDRTVRRHLADLEADGLLYRERTAQTAGRGRARDRILLNLDQPAKLAGKKGDDQPATDDRLTGQSEHDQPATDDTALHREPSGEPSGTEKTSPEKPASPPSSGPDDSDTSAVEKADGSPTIINLPTGGRLSNLLADLIKVNDPDGLRPTITKDWLAAERLLVTKDGRDPEMAAHLIRWCQMDGFWRGNIKSMPKFRAKYSTLYDHSRRSSQSTGSSAASERIRERLEGSR